MSQQELIKLGVLLTKLLAALLLAVFGRYIGKKAKWVALGTSILSLGLFLAYIPTLKAGLNIPFEIEYLPTLGIKLSLNIDWLSFPFLLTEEFVTIFAMVYSLDYLKNGNRDHFFYALLLVFSAGMSGTTMANDIFLFYFFWELMLIASTLLLVNWGESEKRGAIALKYFIITHLGSLLVLVAFIMIYTQSGVDHFTSLQAALQTIPEKIPLIGSLFLIGFGVKMALVPFHIWLPDTHSEAPMPVTIMLAAAMLSMGTYGILRFPMSFLSMEQMAVFSLPMMIAGVVSEIYGAIMALVETDIKRIIAYSSVSQMGYILFGLGTMTYSGIVGSTLHVIYHAIVKALLFCCVGWIIKATGKRDINMINGLGKKMPLLSACTVLGALAIAGVPSLALFNSEWLIFSSGFQTPYLALAILEVLGSLLTVVYILRFVGQCFFTSGEVSKVNPVPLSIKIATVSLSGLTIVAGFFPKPLFDYVVNELPLILGGGW
ncbi:MAG TPA: hypothetical protein DCK95_04345 [Anaerolineaceae bacterium]|nr:hypothetical protein [Anaerolineaceae bacterium]